jgi:predicted phosphodiesterase
MADNTELNSMSGGDTVATDDISGIKYQRIKLIHGVNGTNDGDVASTNPLPSYNAFATIGDNRKVVTTAGTAVALASSTAIKRVYIQAETDNTGVIVVGASTVVASLSTRRGIALNAGDTLTLDIDNLADIYIDSTVNGDGVTFTYYV